MVVPVWVGHLNPMTTLGRALERRGHDVAILSFPEAAPRVAKAGLKHVVIGADLLPAGEWERRTRELSVRQGLRAAHYTIRWLDTMVQSFLRDLPALLPEYDGLVMDQVAYGAETAAEATRTPLAIACNALPVHFQPDVPVHSETWPYSTGRIALWRNRAVQELFLLLARSFLGRIRAARRSLNLSWNVREFLNETPPSLAQVAQLPACLDFPRRHAPAHFHHTGPWHEPAAADPSGFDWSWLNGRPLIYASLGTLQNGLDHLYQMILDACAGLLVQVVLCLGREGGRRPARVPSNATVLGYGPQLALLRKASLVITHAGLNTTLESLAQGLPLVALPIANEQPGIAARVRQAGVGDWLPIRGLGPEKLRQAVLRIQGDSAFRQRAQACAREMARSGGAARAAEIIEEAVIQRKRVLRGRPESAERR